MSVVVALTLLHFIWQGTVIALAAWMAMKLVRSASARYYIGVAALALMAASPVVTGIWVGNSVVQGPGSWVQSKSGVQGPSESRVQGPASRVQEPRQSVSDPGPTDSGRTLNSGRWTLDYLRPIVHVSPTLARWLLGSWLLGVGFLSVRLSFGLWTARRLTRVSVREPRLEVLSNAERLMAALHITGAVTVLESALVKVPTAMGWLKPVVLLPAQAMTGLSMAQIDALVAHELAHIKRHDYLVNLLQSAIETLLFYHPAVWLVSRSVRHERELCCDDMAIAACGDDRLTYASALADLESMRQVPEPMLAANGGSLLTRVRRILAPDDVQTVRGRGHWMAGVAILLAVLIGAATQSVQGRQVVQGVASGVVNGIANGVKGGVTGGIAGGVSGGVIGGINGAIQGGVAGGAKDGVTGGVADGIVGNVLDAVDADQQKIATGQIIRLEVTVNQAAPKLSPKQKDMAIAAAFADWNRAKDDAARARAEADRLAKVNLRDEDAALDAAKTDPYLSNDSIVRAYFRRIFDLEESKKRMVADLGYGAGHPRMVAADTDILSNRKALIQRLPKAVDDVRMIAEAARQKEDRFKAAYDDVARSNSAGAAVTVRSSELSKDYTVQEDGTILLPYAGSVKAASITLAALQTSARTALNAQGQHVVKVLASIEARALDAPPRTLDRAAQIPPAGLQRVAPSIVFNRTSVRDAILTIGGAAAIAVTFDPAVPKSTLQSEYTAKFEKRTLQESLDEVLSANGLAFAVIDTKTILISAIKLPQFAPAAAESAAAPQAPISAKLLYDNAYADYAATRYDLAIQGFQAYLKTYPSLPDAYMAQFFIGEAHYASRRYSDAQAAYSNYIDTYPGTSRLADAYYKRALSYREMGQVEPARSDLRFIARRFPDNTLTPLATAALAGLPQLQTAKVKIMGAVNKPGNHELASDRMNIADAIVAAGGLLPEAAYQVRVRRTGRTDWEVFSRTDLDKKLIDIKLADGDTVDVPIALRFFVVGSVATPGQWPWEEDLTLERALLKVGGVTPDGATNRIEVRRKDPKTKEYKPITLDKDRMQTIILGEDIISVPKRRM